MPAIETRDLTKTYISPKKEPGVWGGIKGLFSRQYTEVKAVREINLSIEQGEMVGFLGPNGAGKTTTLKMLSGILYPTSGEAKVLGFTPSQRRPEMLRQMSLVMGNKNQLWWDLPAWESFRVLKELYEVSDDKFKKRTEFLIEELELTDKVNIQVRKLSLGERMKCELVAALLYSPRIVFLDEPTIGLDVVSQKRIRDFLKELHREDNCTVLLTSHYMQDVQELCKRVVVIDEGMTIYEGTLEDLTRKYSDHRKLRLSFSTPVDLADLESFGAVNMPEPNVAVIDVPRDKTAAIISAAMQKFPVNDVAIEEVEIEDVIRDLFTTNRS